MASFLRRHVPPLLYAPQTRDLCNQDLSELDAEFPLPSWTFAKKRTDGGLMPQTIAHRGYRAVYPENTMLAFEQALAVGANALETDLHISKDGVLVLSHDGNMKRCFGLDKSIIDCTWEYLSKQKTLAKPHESMPRLVDLLEYLTQPDKEDVWVLLDIKVDVDATLMMSLIAKTLQDAPASSTRAWNQRILLGIWGAKYLPLCKRFLPGYSVTNICFSSFYARRFFSHPYVSFNIRGEVVSLWPIGPRFIRDAHERSRSVVVWTVNDDDLMRWSIGHRVDGVITDDPKRFGEVVEEWTAGHRNTGLSWKLHNDAVWWNVMGAVFSIFLLYWRVEDLLIGRGRKKDGVKYSQLSGSGNVQDTRVT